MLVEDDAEDTEHACVVGLELSALVGEHICPHSGVVHMRPSNVAEPNRAGFACAERVDVVVCC